jgi:hypothetical protein
MYLADNNGVMLIARHGGGHFRAIGWQFGPCYNHGHSP